MFITRANQLVIFNSFEGPFITAILGPRRVGKSSLVATFIAEHPGYTWVQLNMDDLFQRQEVERQGLSRLIEEEALQAIGSRKLWVSIDEAQKCPQLFNQIKMIYDNYKDQNAIKFILTGSALLQLHQLSAETLAGRIEIYHLQEFNLHEAAILLHPGMPTINTSLLTILSTEANPALHAQAHVNACRPLRSILLETLDALLLFGGLPEVLLEKNTTSRLTYLKNYLQTYLEKDVRAIETVTDLVTYQKLIDILAMQTGSLQDDQKILNILACSRVTLKKYRGYLIATLMVKEVSPYISNVMKRLVKSPKMYLLNNGLVNYLSGVSDINVLKTTGLLGHRFETWVLQELTQWLSRDVSYHHIHFWRTSGGAEIDFIIDKKSMVLPFEVTCSSQIDKNKLRNLMSFLADEPSAPFGMYVYLGDYRYDEENRLFYIPAWALG